MLNSAGQFQVIIGTEVDTYYKALVEALNISETSKEQIKSAARSQMKWHEALLSHFAEIFFPLLPALISGGLILGFRNVLGDIAVADDKTGAALSRCERAVRFPLADWRSDLLLFAGGDLLVGGAQAGGTPILGIVLGITLVSPQLMNAYLIGSRAGSVELRLVQH